MILNIGETTNPTAGKEKSIEKILTDHLNNNTHLTAGDRDDLRKFLWAVDDILGTGTLSVRKVYASITAMNADTSPTDGETGKPLKFGQLVSIANVANLSDPDNGKVYRRVKNGWEYSTKIGNGLASSMAVNTANIADPSLTDLQKVVEKISNNKTAKLSTKNGKFIRINNLTNIIGNVTISLIFRMPTNITFNQIILEAGNQFMISCNLNKINIYGSKDGSLSLSIEASQYAGKIINFKLIKSSNAINVLINGISIASTTLSTPTEVTDNTIYIGSYRGTSLFSDIDLYAMNILVNEQIIYDLDITNKNYEGTASSFIMDMPITINTRPIAKLNGTSSYYKITGNKLLDDGNLEETILIKCKLYNSILNQPILSFGSNSLYVGIYQHKLSITQENNIEMYNINIDQYINKDVAICIIKGLNSYKIFINGIQIPISTSAGYRSISSSNVCFIGKYSSADLFTAMDIYSISIWKYAMSEIEIINASGDYIEDSSNLHINYSDNTLTPSGWLDIKGRSTAISYNVEVSNNKLPNIPSTPINISSYLSKIPSTIYLLRNYECNLYYDNIIPNWTNLGYKIDVSASGNYVRPMNRCLRMLFKNSGNYTININLYDIYDNIIESKIINAIVTTETQGSGYKQILMCGDSTIDDATIIDGQPYYEHSGPAIVQELYDLLNANKGFTPRMIGHKTSYPPYYHAGMSGWSSSWFVNSNSPFWDVTLGRNNFTKYITEKVIPVVAGSTNIIDFFVYQIGINDLKNNETPASTVINNIKTLISQLLSDYPNCKVIIGFPASGCDATGYSEHFFGISSFVIFRKKMLELWSLIIENFDNGAYNNNVTICNSGQWIDRIYGYPNKMLNVSNRSIQQELTHWDSVHPNKSGYQQMADAYCAKIKFLSTT